MLRLLAALAFIATVLAAPVEAGGSFSLSFNARNAQDAQAIRTGLFMYRLFRDIKSNGHISQSGVGHAAALAQGGRGNVGLIHQDGADHEASLRQTGDRNSCGVFQFGRGARNHVRQSGGGACIVIGAGF